MDYNSLSSEIIDSWDFIKPPAKDLNRDLFRERKSIDDNNPCYCLLKGVRKKLSRRKEPIRNKKKVESSTSLILKKTTERQVFNDYSVLSFTNILQTNNSVYGDFDEKFTSPSDKPLIKVTVIPKNKQKQSQTATNTQRRRKKNPYKISNPDTSINTKNVYVVVAGRKREKVYQINTLNNETCCAGPDGLTCLGKRNKSEYTTPTDYIRDCERLRDFFNSSMQRYLDTGKKQDREVSADYADDPCVHDCRCSNNEKAKPSYRRSRRSGDEKLKRDSITQSDESVTRMTNEQGVLTRQPKQLCDECRPHKSRIRISGRLGLTDNDNYVLKCNATVDDKPIPTQFQAADCTLLPVTLTGGKDEKWPSMMRCFRPSRIQRDSVSQANVCNVPCPARPASPTLLGKSSQATQVDFDIIYRKPESSKKVNYDKVVQCYCVNTADNGTCVSEDEEDVAVKECQSPLVIISVYPKHDSVEKIKPKPTNNINRVGISQELIKQFSPQVYGHKVKQIYNAENKPGEPKPKKAAGRSRSPSPAKATNKEKGDKDVKTRVFASNSKKVIRETTSSGTTKKTKIMNKLQSKSVFQANSIINKKSEQKPKSRPPSPKASSPSKRPGSPKLKQHVTIGTNTEQMLAKKALVDDFTKKYTAQMEKNVKENPALNTKHNVSTVTVNIDGDKEYYNVRFSQGEMDAGVTVRKTIKNNFTGVPGDNEPSTSLENFLFIQPENEPRKRSFSQTLMFDGLQNDPPNMTSRLNVRDSIEISHRREERTSNVGKITQTHISTNTDVPNDVDPKYLVQLKHFRGDDCSISDPIERDREIRELLGIDKGRFKPPMQKPSEANEQGYFGKERHQTQAEYSSPITKHNVACENTTENFIVKLENKSSPYQELIQDRSIKLLLRLDQRNKQKSIVLTPQQYAKVRKTIYHILLKKNCLERRTKCSLVSVGKVKARYKEEHVFHFNKITQTEIEYEPDIPNVLNVNHSCKSYESKKRGPVMPSIEEFVKPNEVRSSESKHDQEQQEAVKSRESIRTLNKAPDRKESPFLNAFTKKKDGRGGEKFETTVLFNACHRKCSKKENTLECARKTASSVEIHYARVEYTKRVMFSSSETHTPPPIPRNLHRKQTVSQNSPKVERKNSTSIHTIFKGRRRPLTPNLGTSAYSLYPEGGSEHSETRFKCFNEPVNYELKPKKPFLKRLISCLVMRASRVSETKFPVGPVHKNSSVNSSIDSYHINSSLGAVDMSSSIYDTSASFYSNHTILPVTRMQKRGFFSSVRVFINNRRS
ncbi:uncharacterized protein [Choristoneura fumiferana]|uniref:uncharacterized protein n=1 Tax=Choristoneura fumiferana TaxID=7141 RepID=UPI003D15AF06